MKLGIYLKSEIPAFTITEIQLDSLRKKIPNCELVNFKYSKDLLSELDSLDILITWVFKVNWYQYTTRLKKIFTPAAGKDWIEKPIQKNKLDIYFGRFHGKIMSESLLQAILYNNLLRTISDNNQKEKIWERTYASKARTLSGQNILIAGYGEIGRKCAKLLNFMGANIYAMVRNPQKKIYQNDGIPKRYLTINTMPEVLKCIDHFVAILPKSNETKHILRYSHLLKMKASSFFYNIGRGNCIKERDILKALDENKIKGASLDVFETEPIPKKSKIWEHPKVRITPHSTCIVDNYLDLYFEEFITLYSNTLR